MTSPLKKKNQATFGPNGGYMPGYGAVPPTTYSAQVDLNTCKVTAAGPSGITVIPKTYSNLTIPVSNGSITSPWTTTASINTAKVKITESDIEIDGLSLKETMKKLHERMAILIPNPKLEEDFERLQQLREQYETLERELLSKAEMWDTLKNADTK